MLIYNEALSLGIKVEAKTYGSLLSLVGGVSPSNYLSSGAENRASLNLAPSLELEPQEPDINIFEEGARGKFTDSMVREVLSVRAVAYIEYLKRVEAEEEEAEAEAEEEEEEDSSQKGNSKKRKRAKNPTVPSPSSIRWYNLLPPFIPPLAPVPLSSRLSISNLLLSHMTSQNFTLSETVLTACIRINAKSGEEARAEEFLKRAEEDKSIKIRNRLFLDVLTMYASPPDPTIDSRNNRFSLPKVLATLARLTSHNLAPNEIEYRQVLRAAIHVGDVAVARKVLEDVAEDVLMPSAAMVELIVGWFESGHEKGGWTITNSCSVATATGAISSGPCSGEVLSSIEITPSARSDLIRMNEEIVTRGEAQGINNKFQGGGKGEKRLIKNREKRVSDWNNFKTFCNRNSSTGGNKFTVVVDGANVGYYKALTKHVNYLQIDKALIKLRKLGHAPLLILHSRHFGNKTVPQGRDSDIVDKWERGGYLWKCPSGCNDDWFWLHAALKVSERVSEGVSERHCKI